MARSAKQVAAQRKASAVSAAKRKKKPQKSIAINGKRMTASEYSAYRAKQRNVKFPWGSDVVAHPKPPALNNLPH